MDTSKLKPSEIQGLYDEFIFKKHKNKKRSPYFYLVNDIISENMMTEDDEKRIFTILKNKYKIKKAPTAFNLFISDQIKNKGKSFKEAIEVWKTQKNQ